MLNRKYVKCVNSLGEKNAQLVLKQAIFDNFESCSLLDQIESKL
jgi:hypothetical protein